MNLPKLGYVADVWRRTTFFIVGFDEYAIAIPGAIAQILAATILGGCVAILWVGIMAVL
ncbi:hypothetical protein PGH45_18385 [Legionella pneumophila]|nr:hypothetical protein [Legionella pneumophila]